MQGYSIGPVLVNKRPQNMTLSHPYLHCFPGLLERQDLIYVFWTPLLVATAVDCRKCSTCTHRALCTALEIITELLHALAPH